ncbi:TetR/AcrR family transcriptional regulator (plasmid) [Brucella anthropi]|nr:TetR/AcrR family transcriptional regulator [Brucella anthropi]KAB2729846.1 TetR/AcrR family transcriptional regulator [Brucella anthropi]QQC26912.1 TetR/AcrR family transcriptional regulator [Brucella anthropi]SUB55785.1 Rut operon repressor [Brucella anthropi]
MRIETEVGAKKKRIRDPRRTQQHIIECAIDEFTERGFDGARIDAIAEQSQTNKSLIYKYFTSKDELYIASLSHTYERLRASQHEIDLDENDPVNSMRKLVESTFNTFANNPQIVRMMTHENVQNARFLKQALSIKLLYTPLLEKLSNVIKIGQEQGLFRENVDLKHLYVSISALGYFYFSNTHTLSIVLDEDFQSSKHIVNQREQAVDMVLSYLQNRDIPNLTSIRIES